MLFTCYAGKVQFLGTAALEKGSCFYQGAIVVMATGVALRQIESSLTYYFINRNL